MDRLLTACAHHADPALPWMIDLNGVPLTEDGVRLAADMLLTGKSLPELRKAAQELCACRGTGWVVASYEVGEVVEVEVPGFGWQTGMVEAHHHVADADTWEVSVPKTSHPDDLGHGFTKRVLATSLRLPPGDRSPLEETDAEFLRRRREALQE